MNELELISMLQKLDKGQLKDLSKLLGVRKQEKNKDIRDIDEEHVVFDIQFTMKCRLCGSDTTVTKKSSTRQNTVIEIASCAKCQETLGLLSKEELIDRLIRMADPLRFSKPALQPYRHIARREEDEVEERPVGEGTGGVQSPEASEVHEEEGELGKVLQSEDFDLDRIAPELAEDEDQ